METINPIRDGLSIDQAIINEKSQVTGVAAEYTWLEENYPGYKLCLQALSSVDNKNYDIIMIETAKCISKKIYFDITGFQGNF
jgi:hypothetical protein